MTFLVLHVIDSLGRVGGAEEQLLENLRRFKDDRLQHQILCLYELESGSRSNEVPSGVHVTYVYPPGVKEASRFHMVQAMYRSIRAVGPDLMHCGLPNAGLGARLAGRRLGIPVIESLVNISHESVRLVDNPAVASWKLRAHRLLDRITMRSVSRFQALSQAVASSWIETVGLRADRVVVIPRGIDMGRFSGRDRAAAREHLLESLGLPEDAFVVLNVGRQVPQKGQLYAVQAMPELLQSAPTAVLLSAGTPGPMTDRLSAEVAQLGIADRVIWLGVRDDISVLLLAADAFVFPSLYEGLGVSLLEAMAAGLPVVTANVAPMTEVVTDRVTGLLVEPRQPAAIAAALRELAANMSLRDSLGAAASAHIAGIYASPATAASVEAMYRQVLALSEPGTVGDTEEA